MKAKTKKKRLLNVVRSVSRSVSSCFQGLKRVKRRHPPTPMPAHFPAALRKYWYQVSLQITTSGLSRWSCNFG